ncbi:MAG: hypothetical protein KME38_15970 [Spirirestis rafaelensis WJT71-NPBG6]|nr:hypothetical protein [Spirirestis rafaelensis WJT71-NPBG6]
MKLASHQKPGVALLFKEFTENNAFTFAVTVRLFERDLSECIIQLYGDRPYWCEQDIYRQDDGEWMFSVESQRGLSQRIWKLSTQTVEEFIAMIISKVGERSLFAIQNFSWLISIIRFLRLRRYLGIVYS